MFQSITLLPLQLGQLVRIYYDALGRPKRTLNPDGTEQRVVYGVPNQLNTPESFKPSPWERFTYDANDLAPLTHPEDDSVAESHYWTPKSEVIDALGRTVKTTEHLAHYNGTAHEDVVMKYRYDIKGQLLEVTDPLDRVCFEHTYDTAGNNLWTEHLDSGEKTLAVDSQGKPLYSTDAKEAAVYTAYDALHRPTDIWAKDAAAEDVTLRQHMVYGDSAGLADPTATNHNGKLYEHYDEAGYVKLHAYDFKGNPLTKERRVIDDAELTDPEKYVVEWTGLSLPLDNGRYVTDLLYDGLNRLRKSTLPADVENERKELVPTYNRAGALQAITFDGSDYVRHIAYNAKGQRVLLAMGNDMMTRYVYDPLTYRLARIRCEAYTEANDEYTPDGNVQQDLAYLYDLAGNIVGIRDKAPANNDAHGPGDVLKQFEYDPLNRLLSATGRESTAPAVLPAWDAGIRAHNHAATNTYTRNYQFDELGNVLQEQHTADGNASNSFTKTFQYHATQEHNKLLSFTVGGTTYAHTYDANGNLLTETTSRHHEWGYDDKLRLFRVEASGTPSQWSHYLYDSGGQRVKKVYNVDATTQRITVYIDGVFEHSYTKTSGTLDTDRHYNTLHVLDGTSRIASVQVGTDADEPNDYPPIRYNVEDHLGNSCVELDGAGALINREEYYPFGDTCFGAFAKKRYRYNGKEKDGESGLYNYGMRYYAPWTCRFISVDPLAPKYPFYTPYQYAGNKPINYVDLDGLEENTKQQPPSTSNKDSSSTNQSQGPPPIPNMDFSKFIPEVPNGNGRPFVQINHLQAELENNDRTKPTNYSFGFALFGNRTAYLTPSPGQHDVETYKTLQLEPHDPTYQQKADRWSTLNQITGGFSDDNIVKATGAKGGGLALLDIGVGLVKTYHLMELDQYNRDRSTIEARRESINDSGTYGAWMLNCFGIALRNGVFKDTGRVDVLTGVDIVNYALLQHSGNSRLLANQRYGAQPADMSREQYSALLSAALTKLEASISENLEPQVLRAEHRGRVLINEVRIINSLGYGSLSNFRRNYLGQTFAR